MSLSAGRVGVRADQVDAHGRVISPSFLNEIMEDLPEWTDLPVRVNGTEELIPSNPSVPVTSPILTDIDYPDIRRNDQYFTYRESPTTVDGLAKIKSIKGNTLVWNQLVRNGDFANPGGWSAVRGSLSASNKILSYRVTELGGGGLQNSILQNISIPANHKVFYNLNINPPKAFSVIMDIGGEFIGKETTVPNTWNLYRGIRTLSSAMTEFKFGCPSNVGNMAVGDVIQFKNPMLIDLTLMFGAGNEPSTVDEFTSFFPLPYYAYNSGSLLSFNGTGIMTTGKNRLNNDNQLWGTYGTSVNGYTYNTARLAPYLFEIEFAKGQTYTISYLDDGVLDSGDYLFVGVNQYANGTRIADSAWQRMPYSFTVNGKTDTVRFTFRKSNANANCEDLVPNVGNKLFFQLEEGATASPYERYISITTELPVLTYFPTGMKSAGTVYDELTPSKAITRIGAVDLGSLTWSRNPTNIANRYRFFSNDLQNIAKAPTSNSETPNIICSKFSTVSYNTLYNTDIDKVITISSADVVSAVDSSYTDATAFKSAMSGVYLYYELATPVELPILDFGE